MKFDVKTWIVCAIPDCENRMILLRSFFSTRYQRWQTDRQTDEHVADRRVMPIFASIMMIMTQWMKLQLVCSLQEAQLSQRHARNASCRPS